MTHRRWLALACAGAVALAAPPAVSAVATAPSRGEAASHTQSAADVRAARLLPAYWAAVRDYQVTHGLERAFQIVGTWPRSDAEHVVDLAVSSGEGARLAAAMVFHLDLAVAMASTPGAAAPAHLELAERLIRGGAAAIAEAEGPEFVGRWYAVAASFFVAQTDVPAARPIVERGIERAPESAQLRLMAGVLDDMEAQQVNREVAQDAAGPQVAIRRQAQVRFDVRGRLAMAERAFRQALRLDPALMAARLRLGRVLGLLERDADARAMLQAALQDATSPADRYLARLFLAELHVRAGELDHARSLLDQVRAETPDRQTAWLALAVVEERAGRPDRARAIVHEGLTRASAGDRDEWSSYRNGDLDWESLAWLRARVWR